jgi:putative glutamine amidotransferase
MRRLPWVGLPTDSTVLGHHRFAVAGESTCARWPRRPR